MTDGFWDRLRPAGVPGPLTPPGPCPACGGPNLGGGMVVSPGTEHEWHRDDCPALAHGIPVSVTINGMDLGQVLAVPVVEGQDPVAAVGAAIAEFGQMMIRAARGEPL